jgi:competence protein ComEC
MAISITIRQKADAIFKKLIPSRQEQAIASGLVLGIRDGLDNEIKQAYASAGAMHILAVSGAHVVIVFGILAFFLRRIKRVKFGNWLFAAISLCLLWMYAFVTGLSASVLRAVIMFSFVIIADAANRQKSIYNTLAASAFGLLFYDPYLLMDVGFQLSYAAVLSIVYITPKLSRLLEVDNYVLSKAWQVSCASIAAQVGTLPLSLLYFHQFPVYFLLANLFVILLSSIILYLGIFTLLFSAIPYLSTGLAFLLKWFVWALNQIAFLTEDMPGALIRNISISATESCIIYLMIISFLLFLYYKKLVYWAAMVGMACVLSVFNIAEVYKQQKQQQMAFYSIAGHSAFSLIEGNHNTFLADSALLHNQNTLDFHLSGHWRQSGISQSEYIDLYYSKDTHLPIKHYQDFSLMVWHGKTFLFLSRPLHNWQPVAQLQPDYLIIQNNAIKELPDKDISFKYLLIDGNNKPYLAKKLKLQALQANIPCFSIGEEGAFLLSTK